MLASPQNVAAAKINSAPVFDGNASHAEAALGPAQLDSLVAYTEDLEERIDLMEIRHAREMRDANTEIRWTAMERDFYKQRQPRWYHDGRLWFLIGALSAYATVNVVSN